MDPLNVLVTAFILGATEGLKPAADPAIKDAYVRLKSLLLRKFGDRPDVRQALETLEQEGGAEEHKLILRETLEKTGANTDEEILAAGSVLLEKTDPRGAQAGKYQIVLSGSVTGAVIGDHARVYIGTPGAADQRLSSELADFTQMRADYLASLRRRFEYLDLGGIAPRVQNRTVKLRMEDVFVPVQARPELESNVDWMDEMPVSAQEASMALRMLSRREGAAEGKPVEIPDLLHRPRIVVLGDPGSGKSTLLRHIAYAVAYGKAEDVGEAALERLPIFVRIAQFSQARADNHTLTLDTYIRETCEPRWAPLFQHALNAGQALVLLDGLDEVVDAHQRKGIAEGIQTLAFDSPDNAFLVTSRIVGYQAARLIGDFAHYTIQSLPLERITEFVAKWYTAIEREAGSTELSEEARERAKELSRAVQERPGIQRLAENPLLLTIIALVNWRGRKLPNRRVELYAHAAETFIASWPYQRQGVTLDTERVIRLLSPVAYRIFATRSSADIAEDELLPVLSEAICRVDGVDERTAKAYAAEFLEQISEHSGIFRERGFDERGRRVFGFLHLTFAEYFTARYLAGLWEDLGEDDEVRRVFLRKYARVPRWREVIMLMAGDVGLRDNDRAARATRLLGDILTLGSEYEDKLHRDLLLAGECLADDLRVQPRAARYALDKLLELMPDPAVGMAVQHILCAMRETLYRQPVQDGVLAQLQDEDKWVRVRAAEVLGEFGDARAVDVLIELLDDEDKDVRASAAWALGKLSDPRAVEGLLARLADEDSFVRERVAWALGELGDVRVVQALRTRLEEKDRWVRAKTTSALEKLDDPRTMEVLLAQLEDENWSVRLSSALALRARGDLRAVEPLLARLEDEVRDVRVSVVEALGALGDPRAVEPLLMRLQHEHPFVRERIAWALGVLSDSRAVEPLLALLKDKEGWVRWSAAWALGKLGDPRAFEPLLMLLDDEDGNVRLSAARALGVLGDPQAVEALLVLLEDENSRIRLMTALSLRDLGDLKAVEPLLARLEDKDKWVRRTAHEVLIAILNRSAPSPEPEVVAYEAETAPGPWDN